MAVSNKTRSAVPSSTHFQGHGRACSAALLCLVGTALNSSLATAGPEDPAYLQWFELSWADMTYRMPDFYAAGYNAAWIPPVGRSADSRSVGYDPFDRFDLGTDANPTTYGTEADFIALVEEYHRANSLIYIDWVMNHNSGRTDNTFFQDQGGWPGFWLDSQTPAIPKGPTDPWGDFHGGVAGGFLQSENPNDPRYDLFNGDLVALIDIAQESDNQFIRHPVVQGDPNNIPGGTTFNRPAASNAAFYPDRDLPPLVVQNPGTPTNPAPANPGYWETLVYPFNTDDPMQGDPVLENATGVLVRATQRMLDVYKVDGFRLDAAKHIPSWFWDQYWDTAVYNRRVAPDGSITTPFSFVESVQGNQGTLEYTRKDGFGNRDALDLNGASAIRSLINGNGFGTWADVLGSHLDVTDNGFQDGSRGLNHPYSHDNGSAGDGGSAPPAPSLRAQAPFAAAYTLFRPGPPIIYHNPRGIARTSGFFPREGYPYALGFDPNGHGLDTAMTSLVQARNMVGRGDFYVLNGSDPVNQSINDVLVFERRTNGVANVLVAVNDVWAQGSTARSVQTSFPPGTRLHELSGTASDQLVDPNNAIPQIITVDGTGRVLVPVPHNANSNGVDHGRGYVVYAPALPTGTLSFTNQIGTVMPDDASVPTHRRRLISMPIIQGSDAEIRLTTTQTDPLDPAVDDNALFKINAGYVDYNGNGQIDFGGSSGIVSGYEQFLTLNQPLSAGGSTGNYRQTIDTTQLDDGVHYLSVIAFRQRPNGTAPLFREWRQPFFVDNIPPQYQLISTQTQTTTAPRYLVQRLDDNTDTFHFFYDLPATTDPIPLLSPANRASRVADDVWSRTFPNTSHGYHTLTVVGIESLTNSTTVQRYDVFVNLCSGDIADDFGSPITDGQVSFGDFLALLGLIGPCTGGTPGCPGDIADDFGTLIPDGQISFGDFLAMLGRIGPC